MKKITFSFYEHDIIYLLNCICLTKDILNIGRAELYNKYFKKENYNTYINDLTLMQRLIGYKANQKIYNYNDYDFFIGHHDYLRAEDGTFNYLKDKSRIKRIKNEIKLKNKIYNNNIKSEVVYLRSTFKKHILNFYRFYK